MHRLPSTLAFILLTVFTLLATLLTACSSNSGSSSSADAPLGDQHPLMQPSTGRLFDLPWPNDLRRDESGRLDLQGFPGADDNAIIAMAISLGSEATYGFSTNSAIYFSLSQALDESSLPSVEETLSAGSNLVLINLQPSSERYLEQVPLISRFFRDTSNTTPGKLLALAPLPGFSMEPAARYAVVLMGGLEGEFGKALRDDSGHRLSPSTLISALQQPWNPTSDISQSDFAQLQNQYRLVSNYVSQHNPHSPEQILAFSVFTTQAQNHDIENIVRKFDQMEEAKFTSRVKSLRIEGSCSADKRKYDKNPFDFNLVHLSGEIEIPQFQHGLFPYMISGGNILYDTQGMPAISRWETVTFGLAIPCNTPPADGFALTIYGEGFGGDYEHYMNLYQYLGRAASSFDYNHISVAITPSMTLERVEEYLPGMLTGLSFFDPNIETSLQHYLENSEQSLDYMLNLALIYNPLNPVAAVGNQIQAASEMIFLRRVFIHLPELVEAFIPTLEADLNLAPLKINRQRTGIVTQSKSSVPAPLALAAEKAFNFAVINGGSALDSAEASYHPDLTAIWEAVLIDFDREQLDIFHPLAQLIQTFFEPTTPINYADRISTANLLITAGCADQYVPRQSMDTMGIALANKGVIQLANAGVEVSGARALNIAQVEPPLLGNNTPEGFRYFISFPGGHFDAYQHPWAGQFLHALANNEAPNIVNLWAPDIECNAVTW